MIGKMQLRPVKDIDAVEWARYHKAKRITDIAKLRALLPAWLKTHIANAAPPAPFKPDLSVKLPRIETGTAHNTKHSGYAATERKPGLMRYKDGTRREYC